MRVLLADDQPEICSALRLLLEQENGIRIVGEVGEADALLGQTLITQPDLVLLDWELPGGAFGDGRAATGPGLMNALRTYRPNLKVVVLSGRPESRRAALSSGADAFVSKGDPPETLLAVLLDLGAGTTPAAH